MNRLILLTSFLCFFLISCHKGVQQGESQSTPVAGQDRQVNAGDVQSKNDAPQQSFQPFWVYTNKGSRDNHYVPSGFMPNSNCLSLDEAWMENCHDGKTCVKVSYDMECSKQDQKWGGIFWLNPANNWGNRKGGFNLTGAKKLVFWAKGEKGTERIEEFKIGGIGGDFSDSDTAVIGPVLLTNEWREYTIDLRGKDLSYISGGFCWVTNVDVNPGTCVFYLDQIRYE